MATVKILIVSTLPIQFDLGSTVFLLWVPGSLAPDFRIFWHAVCRSMRRGVHWSERG